MRLLETWHKLMSFRILQELLLFLQNSVILLFLDSRYKGPDESESELEESEDDDSYVDQGLNLETEEKKEKKLKRVSFADDVNTKDEVDTDSEDEKEQINPLITDLVGDNPLSRKERRAEKWFNNVSLSLFKFSF